MTAVLLIILAVAAAGGVGVGYAIRNRRVPEWVPGWLVAGPVAVWRQRLARYRELSPAEQESLDEWMAWLGQVKQADAGLREAGERAAAARLAASVRGRVHG
jgi:hypothetical protein